MGTDYGKPFQATRGSYVMIMLMEVGYPMQVDPSTEGIPGFYTIGPKKRAGSLVLV